MTDGAKTPVSGRGGKLVALFTLALALSGALAAFIFFRAPMTPPYFLSVAIGEYKSSLLPPNALGYQDSKILVQHFPKNHVEYNRQDAEFISNHLGSLSKITDESLVIHLSALARFRDGKVFVLGSDADADDQSARFALGDIIKRIAASPARNKLLILDIMQAGPNERFGLFADDIAAQVYAEVAKINPPFFVLLPCSAHQSAQVSEQLGLSLFAYYLDQGLRGFAGPHENTNQRISVNELAKYVIKHVDHHAWETRGTRQTPVLLGHAKDFPLVQVEAVTAGEIGPAPAYPAWLRKGWDLRDNWRPDLSILGPGILRHLDSVLLRTELRWRGGIEEARLKNSWEEIEKKGFEIQVRRIKDASNISLMPHSLPPTAAQSKSLVSVDALRRLLIKAPDPTLEEKDKTKKDALDKELNAFQALAAKQPLEAALALNDATVALPTLGLAQLSLALTLLHSLPSDKDFSSKTFAQTLLLERLGEFAGRIKSNGWEWPTPTVQQALRTNRDAERAFWEIARQPAVLPWVKDALNNADDSRRSGEKELFTGLPSEWVKAEHDLEEASKLYTKIHSSALRFAKARAVCDEALMLLPSLGPSLLSQPKWATKAWQEAVPAAQKLADLLANPDPRALEGGLEIVGELGQDLEDLKRFFKDKERRCLALADEGSGEDYQEIQALLNSPWPTAPMREALWNVSQKIDQRLLKKVQSQDKAGPMGPDSGPDLVQQKKQARFQQAIDMIRLAGFEKSDLLENDLRIARRGADEQAWSKLAEELSAVWPGKLLAEFKTGDNNLLKADRLGRVLSPFDLGHVRSSSDTGHWSQNPTLTLYQKDLAAFWRWLGAHYQSESAAQTEGLFAGVYREWAEEYALLAERLP